MKRDEKTALSRQRVLDAALEAFSEKGYEGASLNTAFAQNDISKGVVYHHFKDKDALYLLCVEKCFDALTEFLRGTVGSLTGTAEEQLSVYFDARLRFFTEQPRYLGIFCDAVFMPPAKLESAIRERRQAFDALNIQVLTALLKSAPLREGLSVNEVVEDLRLYMDYFNLRFKSVCLSCDSPQSALREHEKSCHRWLAVLLYGVWA